MNLNGYIYKITNKINGKVYIGQTIQTIKRRFSRHCLPNQNGCVALHNAITKYGKENFIVELVEEVLVEKLDEREIYWISYYKSTDKKFGYNILLGGNLGRRGFSKLSKEDIDKLIELDKQGISHIKLGELFNIDRKTVTFILKREANYKTKFKRIKEREDIEEIKEFLKTNPTSKEVKEKFKISQTTLFKLTRKLNYHFLPWYKRVH